MINSAYMHMTKYGQPTPLFRLIEKGIVESSHNFKKELLEFNVLKIYRFYGPYIQYEHYYQMGLDGRLCFLQLLEEKGVIDLTNIDTYLNRTKISNFYNICLDESQVSYHYGLEDIAKTFHTRFRRSRNGIVAKLNGTKYEFNKKILTSYMDCISANRDDVSGSKELRKEFFSSPIFSITKDLESKRHIVSLHIGEMTFSAFCNEGIVTYQTKRTVMEENSSVNSKPHELHSLTIRFPIIQSIFFQYALLLPIVFTHLQNKPLTEKNILFGSIITLDFVLQYIKTNRKLLTETLRDSILEDFDKKALQRSKAIKQSDANRDLQIKNIRERYCKKAEHHTSDLLEICRKVYEGCKSATIHNTEKFARLYR